ncbi:MAG: hypothetical protein ACRC7N_12130 [Clostridium sp.]
MKKKSYKVSIILLAISMVLMLSACGKQITLEDAISKTKEVKSYSYSANINVKANGMQQQLGGVAGKVKRDGDNVEATLEISANGLKVPVMVKEVDKKSELFINTQGLLNQAFGLPSDTKYLYISSDELIEMAKQNAPEGEMVDIDNALKSNKTNEFAMACFKDILNITDKYIEDKNLISYKELDGKSKSDSGVFTATINEKDIKEILKNYVNDDKSYENLKKFAQEINPSTKVADEDRKEILDQLNGEFLTEAVLIDLVVEVEDGYITKVKASFTNQNSDFEIEIKLSDIDNVKEISVPSKDDEGVKSFKDLELLVPKF